ncbi:spermatogenesis-associated protein 17 isoform X3 [Mus musculus]|uniref:spermatogenesis-associated protein 17 isoform X3 n=1 Tax=Mus musculus TaxID=10090 RepID=UPI0011AEAA8B|nr:spermatogenesis-associated protein 17 isoform X3 [Mus musculus]
METNSNNFGELQELKDMATLAKLLARAPFLESQYYFRNRAVDSFRKFENDAAVMIQSWFRGCQVRAYMRHLNRVVTIIQKWWRSYLGRKFYQLVVEAAYYTMKMNLYNEMAVRIQRRWRGFRIRKYCFNYYYLKEYLRAVSETNDAIRFQVYTIHLSENILTHGNCGCRRQSLWVTRSTLQKRARPPKALVTGWHAPVSTPSRSRRVCHLSAGSGARDPSETSMKSWNSVISLWSLP